MMPGRTGALCYRLAPDMLTVEQTYPAVVPGAQTAKGTGFEGHAFFEQAASAKWGIHTILSIVRVEPMNCATLSVTAPAAALFMAARW